MAQLILTEIWIYPVKSLGGIRVKQASVLKKGLQYDRRYMLVDQHNQFITQRAVHELALFKLSMAEDGFLVSFKGDYIKLPPTPTVTGTTQKVRIWNDTVDASELDQQINDWFSHQLGFPCRLVYFPEDNERLVDRNFVSGDEQVSLADGYPYLIIGQSSLDDLNSRLDKPVPMNRFRPNFVFAGGEAFGEDKWNDFTIGDNRFKGMKLCARCTIPTVDQSTGVAGLEPLKILATFRKNGSKVNFGQNLIPLDFSRVSEGDPISVVSYHPALSLQNNI